MIKSTPNPYALAVARKMGLTLEELLALLPAIVTNLRVPIPSSFGDSVHGFDCPDRILLLAGANGNDVLKIVKTGPREVTVTVIELD
jgi:hypothetical protein